MTPYKKYVNWHIIEQRILPLANPYTGGALSQNQRVYFGPNTRLLGKTLIGIDLLCNETPLTLNEYVVLANGQLNGATLTLVGKKRKDEILKDFPCQDLTSFNTFGKIKFFDMDIDLESSYVTVFNLGALPANAAIVFNFYTMKEQHDYR